MGKRSVPSRCLRAPWFALLLLVLVGCAHRRVVEDVNYEEPDVVAWADQLGSILEPAQACVERHPAPGAVIVAVRILGTGEIAVMTRTPGRTVTCVHDGTAVVHQAAISLDTTALPFVRLGAIAPPRIECHEVRPLRWGSEFIGWLFEPTC
jgi:hypothetical protein